jgi:hypothetical protein
MSSPITMTFVIVLVGRFEIFAGTRSDETTRYWHLASGDCIKTLHPDRLYEGMDITGIQGLSAGQNMMLKQ